MHRVDLSPEAAHVLTRRCFIRQTDEDVCRRSAAEQRLALQLHRTPLSGSSLNDVIGQRLGWFLMHGSFSVCWCCASVVPRRLRALDFGREHADVTVLPACAHCQSGYFVPRVEDVPAALMCLSRKMLLALRPLQVTRDRYLRPHPQGLRRHSGLLRLQWSAEDVPYTQVLR